MYASISGDTKLTVKATYKGRSNHLFKMGQEYTVTYMFGKPRGYKGHALDYWQLDNGYRILPFEERKFWKVSYNPILLKILYGNPWYPFSLWNLIPRRNPFDSLISRRDTSNEMFYPVPVVDTPPGEEGEDDGSI